MSPLYLFTAFWVGFAISWIAAARWASPAVNQLASGAVVIYRALLVLGGILLAPPTAVHLHAHRLWHVGYTGAYILAVLTLPGFAFAWWARLHLGTLWSSAVTRKDGHRVVDTGPYGIVRHPIYTGILFACLVSALAGANWPALAGLAIIAAGFWVKARAEEGFLAAELGPAAYSAYRARVPMLVPFWPTSGSPS